MFQKLGVTRLLAKSIQSYFWRNDIYLSQVSLLIFDRKILEKLIQGTSFQNTFL